MTDHNSKERRENMEQEEIEMIQYGSKECKGLIALLKSTYPTNNNTKVSLKQTRRKENSDSKLVELR